VTVDDKIEVRTNPELDPQVLIEFRNQKWYCGEKHLCELDEYRAEKLADGKMMIAMDNFDDFLIKTKVRDPIVCRVLDGD